MAKVFMRSQDGNILYFSYYDDDGVRTMEKTFTKVTKGPLAKLELKKYDDIFGARRWAEGNNYLIYDDAPLPHPEKLEGTPPDKLEPVQPKKRKTAPKTKLDKFIEDGKAVKMIGLKCLVKYCRGSYQPQEDKPELRCDKCGHEVDRVLKADIAKKKIDKPK